MCLAFPAIDFAVTTSQPRERDHIKKNSAYANNFGPTTQLQTLPTTMCTFEPACTATATILYRK